MNRFFKAPKRLNYSLAKALFVESEFPFPRVAQCIRERELRGPVKPGFSFSDVCPNLFDITFPPWAEGVRHFDPRCAFERGDDVEHRSRGAAADVDKVHSWLLFSRVFQRGYSLYVRLGEIANMKIVAKGGPVRGVIVIAEDCELFSYTLGRLGDVWEEVLRFSLGEFSNEARGMRADGVEVSQRDGGD